MKATLNDFLNGDAVRGTPMEPSFTSIEIPERQWRETAIILRALASGKKVSPDNLWKVRQHLQNFLALVDLYQPDRPGEAD